MAVDTKGERTRARSAAKPQIAPKSLVAKSVTTIADRRREPRYPCNDDVQVTVLSGNGRRVPAKLVEISRSGLRIELDIPLDKNAQIEIRMSNEVAIFGRVRHCRAVGERHQAGVLIEEAFYASHSREHVSAAQLTEYVTGEGLTIPQAIRVREHLAKCNACRLRIVESYSQAQPPRETGL